MCESLRLSDKAMRPLSVMITPVAFGWAVVLSDGRELARFVGPAARLRALRYIRRDVIGSLGHVARRSG